MPGSKVRVLIVDDVPSIRMSMSLVLTEIGYGVRSAEDGFSALRELRKEAPDILISDLNMPCMSGFELLSVVRRRFPAIPTVAMSGSFSGDEAPSGIAADAFYQKGSSFASLLRIIGALSQPDWMRPDRPAAAAPLWIQNIGQDASGTAYVTIACPECLRTFPQHIGSSISLIRTADCVYCRSSIPYAIVHQAERASEQVFIKSPREARLAGVPQLFS